MAKITCPHCSEVIDIDPSAVEDLTRQLRDDLFAQDLAARLAEAGHVHESQMEAARAEERREADRRVAAAQETSGIKNSARVPFFGARALCILLCAF